MGMPNWSVAWTKRSPGTPRVERVRVARELTTDMPLDVFFQDYPSTESTVRVEQFPGDLDAVGPPTMRHPMPPARHRVMGTPSLIVPSPMTPNTVSNTTRDALASVPEAHLDIFEGVSDY